MRLQTRTATAADLDLLAEWNHQLISDQGHRNPMSVPQLRDRMAEWIAEDYQAGILEIAGDPVGYVLYRTQEDSVHIRHLFVARECRRQGVGRMAIELLASNFQPKGLRLSAEVLAENGAGRAFWSAAGFHEYAVVVEREVPKR